MQEKLVAKPNQEYCYFFSYHEKAKETYLEERALCECVSVQVFWEADTKMELEIQKL